MNKKKFTLIEVLVVVAIIGILASLLLPSLGKARKKAQSSLCINNLKQVSTSLLMNPDDNDDYYVVGSNGNITWDDYIGLAGYDGRNLSQADADAVTLPATAAGGSKSYYCPGADFSQTNATGNPARSYVINWNLSWWKGRTNFQNLPGFTFGPYTTDASPGSVQQSSVGKPSATVMIREHVSSSRLMGDIGIAWYWYSETLGGMHSMHGKQMFANIGFADGSVRNTYLPSTSLTASGSEEMWDLD